MENNRTNFWIWNNYFWKVPILHIIQNHWKNQLYYELLSFNLTVKYIRLYNFRLWRILWTRNAYRLIVWKVFLFQILGETSIFTLPGKVPLWQKNVKMMFCVAIWICMSPRTYWNLNSTKIHALQWLLGFMLVYCSQKLNWYTFPNRFV